eukprot:CAMPEP_0114561610 /NCGR_PEP_ID=MMETSP0114-20121206/12095_1 /TAXON_ID=31324 /ORGANISM="Goniomonas sp, Strain m" /LENGTH=192 /DNA_ID=CAMNT_0001747255 /DNA_START=79 /DNA_END=653 /DNA_ORIENTATION=-
MVVQMYKPDDLKDHNGRCPCGQLRHRHTSMAVEFSWCGASPQSEVLLVSSSDQWQQRTRCHWDWKAGCHKGKLEMAAGYYQFKFIVDGEWRCTSDYTTTHDREGNENNHFLIYPSFFNCGRRTKLWAQPRRKMRKSCPRFKMPCIKEASHEGEKDEAIKHTRTHQSTSVLDHGVFVSTSTRSPIFDPWLACT